MTSQSNLIAARTSSAPRRSGLLRWAGVSLGVLVSGLLSSACSAELVPLAPTEDGVSRAASSGIEVRATVVNGREYIPRSLTPVKLSIRNLSPQGVYLSLDDIRLVGKDTALAAVEPIDIEPRRPVPTMGVDPASPFATSPVPPFAVSAASPGDVASPGAGMGATPAPNSTSGTPVLKHGFGFDPLYPSPDFQGWSSYREYAKHEIRKDAFPGGFIDSGEAQQGYVYFTSPPDGVKRVDLEVKVHSGEGSGPGVIVEIPYAISG
jgi:hypothetical protein